MLTKIEISLVIALVILTIDNGLLAAYVVSPNILLMYIGGTLELLFFCIIIVVTLLIRRAHGKRIIIAE
jgi:hypothetical protein